MAARAKEIARVGPLVKCDECSNYVTANGQRHALCSEWLHENFNVDGEKIWLVAYSQSIQDTVEVRTPKTALGIFPKVNGRLARMYPRLLEAMRKQFDPGQTFYLGVEYEA